MDPHISLPRPHGASFATGSSGSRGAVGGETMRMPRFFKRNVPFLNPTGSKHFISNGLSPTETKNTYHRPDPSFTYLLAFFLLLTSLAWGVAYLSSAASIVRLSLSFIFLHFLALSLLISTAFYLFIGRTLGGRRRAGRGLFTTIPPGEENGTEGLEFGYCFDVAIRAFFPVWVFLYVIQFVMMPLISREYWISLFLGNSLYLLAFSYYQVITFLGYNALPFLHHTELLLAPVGVFAVLWAISLFGFNIPKHVAYVLLAGSGKKGS